MIGLFLANGFEEVEALAPLDMLRRAGVEVTTFGVGAKTITGAHGIAVEADALLEPSVLERLNGVILPGGMPGTKNLDADSLVCKAVTDCYQKGELVAAICAAPSVLGRLGVLNGKSFTCFPGFEEACIGGRLAEAGVVMDQNVITAKGAGCALWFGAALVAFYKGDDVANTLLQEMQGNYEGYSRV